MEPGSFERVHYVLVLSLSRDRVRFSAAEEDGRAEKSRWRRFAISDSGHVLITPHHKHADDVMKLAGKMRGEKRGIFGSPRHSAAGHRPILCCRPIGHHVIECGRYRRAAASALLVLFGFDRVGRHRIKVVRCDSRAGAEERGRR